MPSNVRSSKDVLEWARKIREGYASGESVSVFEIAQAGAVLSLYQILRDFCEFLNIEVSDDKMTEFIDLVMRKLASQGTWMR